MREEDINDIINDDDDDHDDSYDNHHHYYYHHSDVDGYNMNYVSYDDDYKQYICTFSFNCFFSFIIHASERFRFMHL